jgi:hypothetical protein
MAGRVLNRRVLREQADQAEREAAAEGAPLLDKALPKGGKANKPTAPRGRKSRAKKAPARMVARWGVFDGGMKRVAIFDYNQRAAAEEKLADLLGKHKGTYCLQIVKEPMPEPEAAAVPGAG